MDLFTFLVITYSLIDCSKCLEETIADAFGLQILPESMTNGQHIILKQVDETLNLFCRIQANKLTSNKSNIPNYKLSWKLPHLTHNSQNRVAENAASDGGNEGDGGTDDPDGRRLVVENLKESDTGDYECVAQTTTPPAGVIVVRESVRVNVKNKKTRCGESDQMFTCPTAGNCIVRRYVCDGHPDCRDGADEDEAICGADACDGKIRCVSEGRCIPSEWCCDRYSDPNCTVKMRHSCCPQPPKRFYPPEFSNSFTKFSDEDQQQRLHNDDHQRFSDMGFLQTTIYTVIGCAMAFMFIVTILVIAICRVHMKRTLLSRCPNARNAAAARGGGIGARGGRRGSQPPHHHGVAHMPLYDLDVFLNRGSQFPTEISPHSGLLVTYNINNGVQFVGRPVDPPPYCEIVASPPREGPPPPYVSRENLRATLDSRDGDSGAENATENDALLTRENRAGNTLRITVVNTAPRGGEGSDGGRYRLVAVRSRGGGEEPTREVVDSTPEASVDGDSTLETVESESPQVVVEIDPTHTTVENNPCLGSSLNLTAPTEVAASRKSCDQAQLRKDFFGVGTSSTETDATAKQVASATD